MERKKKGIVLSYCLTRIRCAVAIMPKHHVVIIKVGIYFGVARKHAAWFP